MDYDFRKGGSPRGHMGAPYEVSTMPVYRPPYDRSGAPTYGSGPAYYPRVGQSVGPPISRPPPPVPVPSSSSSSPSGSGIRVALKPEYRITPPPQLSPQIGEIPRSTFQFDFDFERKILAEAEKGSQNWSRIALQNASQSKNGESSSLGAADDQVINKYVAMGLNREAVAMAVSSFGDDQNKVREFATSHSLLREMGFPSHAVAKVLLMYDNDRDKAVAYLLGNPS